ncbi:MAG: hypothetical protein WKF57_06670 [Nakamurella sp.]
MSKNEEPTEPSKRQAASDDISSWLSGSGANILMIIVGLLVVGFIVQQVWT